jgi:hypothetical protein
MSNACISVRREVEATLENLSTMAKGVCMLTGIRGKFVDAHLIPKSLTLPAKKGLPFVQSGGASRPIRRWSSWYDGRLVTQHGEDILSLLDNWATAELRRQRLVWSGWGPMVSLSGLYTPLSGTPWGIREIEVADFQRLRLFFLSLLWRAAATTRSEFSEVIMPPNELEDLRLMLLAGNPEPQSFYPIQLTQLSTFGRIHNLAPIAQTKTIPAFDDRPARPINIFRFYFDGLAAHIHRQVSDDGTTKDLGPLIVGSRKKLIISTVTYEQSFERENVTRLTAEAFWTWPEVMGKLL